jgi:hypothetical protein
MINSKHLSVNISYGITRRVKFPPDTTGYLKLKKQGKKYHRFMFKNAWRKLLCRYKRCEPEAYGESCAVIHAVWIMDSELPIWNMYSIK